MSKRANQCVYGICPPWLEGESVCVQNLSPVAGVQTSLSTTVLPGQAAGGTPGYS